MMLIADSGSTKTSWLIRNDNEPDQFLTTEGLNPVLIKGFDDFEQLMNIQLLPYLPKLPEVLHFYCTGYINEEVNKQFVEYFHIFFKNTTIEIKSDLMAAARALLHDQEGIACILGTGSNCCYYNGEKIVQNIPSLGYILGDLGSGVQMGKKLVHDYLKGFLPAELVVEFKQKYPYTLNEFLDKIYRQPYPNRFLAGFTPFLLSYKTHPYVKEVINTCFASFLNESVSRLQNAKGCPLNFVGSIGWHFREELKQAIAELGYQSGNIIKEPIEQLLIYHTKKDGKQ